MTIQGGNCLRRQPSFADPSCRRLAARYPRQRTRSMGAFFCILFCGTTKEYGGGRGRDPATLSLVLIWIGQNSFNNITTGGSRTAERHPFDRRQKEAKTPPLAWCDLK
ncbi:MAG: hypothetical protein R6V21_10760 [Pelovirga sp.]